ncbi:hypothetical protein [Companilactobacillus sp.]|jgi:hypothetical protein|uniref:hypothetical protein n=1 Tax=Companilactobacillus sp. TaxID=2767905 RepID=UPI0025C3D1DD|nr:hypothetical protein [Companilactobacillus sp.]MCH4009733.1 hypothetical protein [Companilactobacillus sp.]MCH4052591.1 hypothetical protein [Companilactobacillus sp.]MCH4077675.1 hypothetical protein [Companilactobacillus sp.]MCH4126251.1 hypothetical protein [Companilactobacillus sp.]MCI1311959.1 hypothetical protein [Companilactobacillus sp.]
MPHSDTIFSELFDIQGLGWNVIFIIIPLIFLFFIWFSDKRYTYQKVLITRTDMDGFNRFSKSYPCSLAYKETNTSTQNFVWIFGVPNNSCQITLLLIDPETPNKYRHNQNYLKKASKNMDGKYSFNLSANEYIAFSLATTENLPAYSVKINFDAKYYYQPINSNLRYGSIADNKQDVKFTQNFRGFVKDIFIK